MREWNDFNPSEIIRKYREFVYETGAAGRSQKSEVRGQGGKKGIDRKIVEQERKRTTASAAPTYSVTAAGISPD